MNENNQALSLLDDTDLDPLSSPLAEEDVPSTQNERVIAEVWAEVLNLDQVGRYDNFFDIGGHSILATQAAARLRIALGRDLPERALFDWPTVATLASALPGYPTADQHASVPLSRRRASSTG